CLVRHGRRHFAERAGQEVERLREGQLLVGGTLRCRGRLRGLGFPPATPSSPAPATTTILLGLGRRLGGGCGRRGRRGFLACTAATATATATRRLGILGLRCGA